MAIAENIKARKAAEAAFKFVESEWVDVPSRFWECLRDMCDKKLPATKQCEPDKEWSELDAQKFEHEYMPPRGQHASKQVINVPPSYLEWWWNNAMDPWTRRLGRYIGTRRFQDRLREEPRDELNRFEGQAGS